MLFNAPVFCRSWEPPVYRSKYLKEETESDIVATCLLE